MRLCNCNFSQTDSIKDINRPLLLLAHWNSVMTGDYKKDHIQSVSIWPENLLEARGEESCNDIPENTRL